MKNREQEIEEMREKIEKFQEEEKEIWETISERKEKMVVFPEKIRGKKSSCDTGFRRKRNRNGISTSIKKSLTRLP